MATILEKVQSYFEPERGFAIQSKADYLLDQQFLAFLVGAAAFGLPCVMLFAGATGATCFYDSISHFYYSQFFGDIFVATLIFIGTFLIAFRGESRGESVFASIAGLCAFGVALLPTSGAGCLMKSYQGRVLADLVTTSSEDITLDPVATSDFFNLAENVGLLHYASAALLLSFLAFYALCIFTRIIDDEHKLPDGSLKPVKRMRNRIYYTTGIIIVLCLLALAARAAFGSSWDWWDQNNATFWLEAIALWAFGFGWMLKGRFWGKALMDERDKRSFAS